MCYRAKTYMWPGQQNGTKLAQNTPYHNMVNILSSVYNICFLWAVKCCLLNCWLMEKIYFNSFRRSLVMVQWIWKMWSNFVCPLGPFLLAGTVTYTEYSNLDSIPNSFVNKQKFEISKSQGWKIIFYFSKYQVINGLLVWFSHLLGL